MEGFVVEKALIVSDETYFKLVRAIHHKSKINDYFTKFTGKDILNNLVVMSIDEHIVRLTLEMLGITSQQQLNDEYNRLKATNGAW